MPVSYDYQITAAHIVRLYFWDHIQKQLGGLWAEFNGQPPIIPAQEQPELQASERPYMVYVYDTFATTDVWQIQTENVMFIIYTQSPRTITATTKLASRLFNKFDVTAQEINAWIQSPDGIIKYVPDGKDKQEILEQYRDFRFKTVRVAGITGAEPSREEGGRMNAAITIEAVFTERKA